MLHTSPGRSPDLLSTPALRLPLAAPTSPIMVSTHRMARAQTCNMGRSPVHYALWETRRMEDTTRNITERLVGFKIPSLNVTR